MPLKTITINTDTHKVVPLKSLQFWTTELEDGTFYTDLSRIRELYRQIRTAPDYPENHISEPVTITVTQEQYEALYEIINHRKER